MAPTLLTGAFSLRKAEVQGGGSYILRVTAVPEPATWAMLLLGFAAIGAMIRRARSGHRRSRRGQVVPAGAR